MGIVVVSLAWTLVAWVGGQFQPPATFASVRILVVALGVSEVLFIGGVILMASAVSTIRQRLTPRGIVSLRGYVRDLLGVAHKNSAWSVGFYTNWVGAVGSTLTLLVALLVLTPPAAWGVGLLLVLDLAATFGIRWPAYTARLNQR
jgi:hypothetical protein